MQTYYIKCDNVKFLWLFFNSAVIKSLVQIRVPSRGCRTMPNRITFPTLQYSNLESEQRLKRNFGSTVDKLRQTGVGKPPTGKNGARTKSNRDDYRHTVSRKTWIIYENIQLFWTKILILSLFLVYGKNLVLSGDGFRDCTLIQNCF